MLEISFGSKITLKKILNS